MKAFTGRPPTDKDAANGQAITDLGAHDMPTPGSAFTAHVLAGAVAGRRHRDIHENPRRIRQYEPLLGETDGDVMAFSHTDLFSCAKDTLVPSEGFPGCWCSVRIRN